MSKKLLMFLLDDIVQKLGGKKISPLETILMDNFQRGKSI
jgi:hypothetical protein